MRVPVLVAIPIVAVCATTGLALGWLFPLTSTDRRGEEPSQVARPPFSPTAMPNDAVSSEGPTISEKHVHEDDWTSKGSAGSNRVEKRKLASSASETAALPSEVGSETSRAGPQNKTTVPQASPPKTARKTNRRSTKEAQKPVNHLARPGRDDYPAREKQPTRNIVTQLPIFGPIFGLLVP